MWEQLDVKPLVSWCHWGFQLWFWGVSPPLKRTT